jgi:hypothetical protein
MEELVEKRSAKIKQSNFLVTTQLANSSLDVLLKKVKIGRITTCLNAVTDALDLMLEFALPFETNCIGSCAFVVVFCLWGRQ